LRKVAHSLSHDVQASANRHQPIVNRGTVICQSYLTNVIGALR